MREFFETLAKLQPETEQTPTTAKAQEETKPDKPKTKQKEEAEPSIIIEETAHEEEIQEDNENGDSSTDL